MRGELKSCRNCGRRLEFEGEICPTCGGPERRPVAETLTLWLPIALIVLPVLLCCGLYPFVLLSGPERPQTVSLEAKAFKSSGSLSVFNRNEFDWSEVQLFVNGEYRCKIALVPAGESRSADLISFTDAHGNSFQPLKQAVTGLRISADTPNGPGACSLSFSRVSK